MGRFEDEGNILVLNQSKNVLVNYNFMLRVEGIYDLPCKSVHSFTKENEFEYVQEGGLNDYVHLLRKPVSKPFSFTVERYVGMDIVPPLPLGAELILPVILMVAPNANQFDKAKRTFVFTGCTVMSKTYGELNAEKSELLTETIVIGYREMTEVTIPVHSGSDGKLWKFDGTNVDGNGERSAKTLPKSETTEGGDGEAETTPKSGAKKGPDTGEAAARQWPNQRSAKTLLEKAKTEEDIRQWPEKSSAKTLPKSEITEGSEAETTSKSGVKKGPDTGTAQRRRWKPTKSAKQPTDTGNAEKRKWPGQSSAKQMAKNKKEE